MRAVHTALVVGIAMFAGCSTMVDADRDCARLELSDWTPAHERGQPVEPAAKLTNCGEAELRAPGCQDGSLELRFAIEGMPDPKDVHIVLCPHDESSGQNREPPALTLPPGGSVRGSASWSGELQTCHPHMCDPSRLPPPGDYVIIVRIEGLSASTNAPLLIR